MQLSAETSMEDPKSKFRPLAELGHGGTATVYLAVAQGPSGFNKLVVLKTLRKNLAEDPDFRNMLMSEARIAARLNHPNIVQTNEVTEVDGVPVIVMEYLEGQTFWTVLKRAKETDLTLPMGLRVVAAALRGLQHAHELADYDGTPMELVHRDLTPHNVFVTYDGHTKILDFGIAKLADSQQTEVGVIKGKLRYMPPEQILGAKIDRRADLYAVGAMLWQIATRKALWKGMSDATVMHNVLQGKVPTPSSVRPEVPKELERICMRALEADREKRYATAAELEEDLNDFLEELGSRVNEKAIGESISTLFADERAKMKALIEQQISKATVFSWNDDQASELLSQVPESETATAGRTDCAQAKDSTTSRRKWARCLLIAAVVAGALTAAWLAREDTAKPTRPPGPHVAASPERDTKGAAPAPATTRVPAKQVTLRVVAFPDVAQLSVDDEPLPTNPASRSFLADGAPHVVKAEAEGYQAATAEMVASENAEIVLKLDRVPARPKKPPKHRPKRVRRRHSKVSSSASKDNCDPPYSVDQNGIRKYRLECM